MQHLTELNNSMDRSLSLFRYPLDEISEGLSGAAPVQCLARPIVEQVSDRIERHLVVDGQVRALGQHLAQQPVGVFTGTSLPRAMRVTEVNTHVGCSRQVSVHGHFFALVVGQRLPQRRRDLVELEGERRQRGLSRRVGHLGQQHQPCSALDQHANGGFVARTFDQVSLPVTRHDAIRGLRRAQMNADHFGNLPPSVFACGAWFAPALALTQTCDEVFAQLAFGMGVDRGVDRLVRDMQFWIVGPHRAQCLRNLLWRPQPTEHMRHHRPQWPVRIELARTARPRAAGLATRLSRSRNIGTIARIAPHLPAQRTGTAPQRTPNGPQTHPLQPHRRQHNALFCLHLLKSSVHLLTLPNRQGVAIHF